jgi:hypothetical protein
MPFPEAASRPFRMRAEGPPTEIDPLRAAVTVGFGAPEYSVVAMRRGYSGRFILRRPSTNGRAGQNGRNEVG